MTIQELIEKFDNDYDLLEVYKFKGKNHILYKDNIDWLGDYNIYWNVMAWQIMDNYDYNNIIDINKYSNQICRKQDFKILILVVSEFVN